MPITPSPLRYPGGKASIKSIFEQLINDNGFSGSHYAEPYAGGAGLAFSLMFNGFVHEIHLNDIDKSIWSFWWSVLNDLDRFIDKINQTPVTIDEWHVQREIQRTPTSVDKFDLAFSTFFLNRTNRSGIILKAGVIGGIEQNGSYKLDCRFNKKDLVRKLKRIEKYKHRIHIYNLDAVQFINSSSKTLPKNSFYYIDPPYYGNGSSLYTNFYGNDDHASLAKIVRSLDRPWVLTYDNVDKIRDLYKSFRQTTFCINYSAQTKRIGTELFIVSDKVILNDNERFISSSY